MKGFTGFLVRSRTQRRSQGEFQLSCFRSRRLAVEPLEERRLLAVATLPEDIGLSAVDEVLYHQLLTNGPAETDEIPPTVTGTTPSFEISGTLGAGTTSLQVTFSEPVIGGGTAANYQLQNLGPDALLGTADDTIVPISVTYSETAATLSFAALPESVYRLTVRDAITDAAGNALHGDQSSAAGGDCVRDFVVLPAGELVYTTPTYASGTDWLCSVVIRDIDGDAISDVAVANYWGHSVGVLFGKPEGGFAAAVAYASGGRNPESLAAGDVNGDGLADLVVANSGSDSVAVLYGRPNGLFASAVTYGSGGSIPRSVVIGDANGDGLADLAVANYGSNNLGVLFGQTEGALASAITYGSGGSGPRSVAMGDTNGDGLADLAVANFDSDNLGVLFGQTEGQFGPAVTYGSGGSDPRCVAIGDTNGDGLADLAVTNYGSDNLGVLFGQAEGQFAPVVTYATGGTHPDFVVLGDVNSDGRSDLTVANFGSANVGVLSGEAGGTFAAPVAYASGGSGPMALAIGNINGDALADLAVANNRPGRVGVLLGDSSGKFAATTTYASGGSGPQSIAIGDVNDDRRPDLAVANINDNSVALLLGESGSRFSPADTYGSGGGRPWCVVLADVNGDHRADLIVANTGGKVGVLLGQANGRFAAATTYASGGNNPISIAIGDLNGDALADIAVANFASNNVGVLLGQVSGGFASAVAYDCGGSNPMSVAIGDLDGDARPDLAVANNGSNNVGVLFGQEGAGFSAAGTYASGGSNPSSVIIGDVNGDGLPDLAVANPNSSNVAVLAGQEGGRFASAVTYASGGSNANSVTIGDVNGDGLVDLAVGNSDGTVGILLGRASGGFTSALTHASGGYPRSLALGDFNGDGRPDLAVANAGSDSIGVLLNALAFSLVSPGGLQLDIQPAGFMAGQLVQGSENAFDGLNRLQVGTADYSPASQPLVLADGMRTIMAPAQSLAGLLVSREITVPESGSEDFARTLDVFRNPTGGNISTTVRIVGNLGSDAATTVFATSDGDSDVETGDQWIGTDDADGTGTPAIIHYVHGPKGLQPTSVLRTADNIEWTYHLTVPAGQTVRLAAFTILSRNRAAAEAAAAALVTPNGLGGKAADFLAQEELDSLANFAFNHSPSNLTLSNASVAENQVPGISIGTLSTADPDAGDAFVYTLVSGTGSDDNASFTIVGNELQTDAVFDYETKPSYSILVRSTDQFGSWIEKQFTIQVEDVDGISPTVTGTTPAFEISGTLGAGTTSLQVTFSEPVIGGGTAANYQLQSLGPDALLGTADDTIVPISVTYSETAATLSFAALPESVYRLTVHDAITDAAGNALHGDQNSAAGGDWVREFVVLPAGQLFYSTPAYASGGSYAYSPAIGDLNGDGLADLAVTSLGGIAVLLGQRGGGFAAAAAYSSGGLGAISLAIGDLNGDGLPDLAVANYASNDVGVLLSQSDGGLAAAVTYASGGSNPYCVVIGDVNGDHLADLVVANGGSDNVGVLLGRGSGGFAPTVTYATGGKSPTSVAIGDVNGDRIADLATANRDSNNVGVLLGQLGSGFADAVTYASGGNGPRSVVVADLNGDGLGDVAVTNLFSFNLGVLLGTTGGPLAAAATYPTGGSYPSSLAISDVDGDGIADVAVANSGSANVGVLLGQVGGGLAAASTYACGVNNPSSVSMGDLNGDGRADLVLTGSGSQNVTVLLRQANGGFAATATYSSAGNNPTSVAIGDLNGDGRADVAVANYFSSSIGVLLAEPSRDFAAPTAYASGGSYPRSVAIGDVNGDERADLVVANAATSRVGVLLNLADGGLGAAITYPTRGTVPFSVAIGDVNGDGLADLALANNVSDDVSVLLGEGNGRFGAATTYPSGGSYPWSVAIGDVNRDGRADLAVTNQESNSVGILLGQHGGGFAAAVSYPSGGSGPSSVAIGDVNGDGFADVVVATSTGVGVLLAQAGGGFAPASTYASGGDASSLAIGDVNGDGRADLAATNYNGRSVGVLLGQAGGGFAPAVTFASGGGGPDSVAIGDINGDARADLVVGNYGVNEVAGNNVAMLRNALAYSFISPNGFLLDVQPAGSMAGQLVQGSANAFDGLNRLRVGTADYAPAARPLILTNDMRTLMLPVQSLAGLSVSREITVPNTGSADFARTIDVFRNPTGGNITTKVRLVGNLGSDAATTVFATSDGDSEIETTDQWIGTDANGAGMPAIIHYMHGPAGLQPTSVLRTDDNVEWTYDLTVRAGQTVRLATFTIMAESRTAAEAAAAVLATPNGFGGQAAQFLTQDQIDSLANFLFNQALTDVSLSNASVAEEQSADTLVGTFSTTDPEDRNIFTYTLVSGTGSDDNASFLIFGSELRTGAVFDYETKSSYSIRVRSTDQDGLWTEKQFTIGIVDVEEMLPTVTATTPSFDISGTLAAGTTSLQVAFSEPVTGGGTAHNYQLQSLGPDGLLGTADDAIVPLSVTLDGAAATLSFSALTESVYRLTARDAITDAAGYALDGDNSGTAGGDWVRDFVVLPAGQLLYTTPAYNSGGRSAYSLAIGDLNGDGLADLAVTNPGGAGILLGQHGGGFAAAAVYSSGGSGAISVAIGDLNGDGLADLAVANYASNNVGLLMGQADGGFAGAVTYASGGSNPYCVAIGDIDGDDCADLVVANSGSDNVGVLLGRSSGAFAPAVTYSSGGKRPVSVAIGNLNGDGIADLATANQDSNNVGVLLGQVGVGFADAVTYASGGNGPRFVAIADLNGDGLGDVAVTNYFSLYLGVLLGTTGGTLSAAATYSTGGTNPCSFAVGDVDGDGITDVAIANSGSSDVGVLLGQTDGRLGAASVYASGVSNPYAVAIADLNGDGRADLALTSSANEKVGVLLRQPGGGFAATSTYAAGGKGPISVAIGDVNGDSRADLAVANFSSNSVGVLLARASGGFASAAAYGSGGSYPRSVAIGDVNGDARADLAVANLENATVGVLLSLVDGGFTAAATYATGGATPWAVAIGDVNGDGRADLAVANKDSNNVGILLGQVGGRFDAAVTYSSGGNSPRSVAIGDVNGDGFADLVVANEQSGNSAGILLGLPGGTFAAAVTYASGGSYPRSVAIGDLNGDGRADVAVANGNSSVGVLLAQVGGGFTAAATYASGGADPMSLAIGDVNGDGRADLAVVNSDSRNVAVLLGQVHGGFAPAVTFASGGGHPAAVAIGDINGDGRADLVVGNTGINNAPGNVAVLPNALAYSFISPHGFLLDVQPAGFMAGQLVQGSENAFDGLNRLRVGTADYAPTAQPLILTNDMRTVMVPVQPLAGLLVSREITVPNTGSADFARTIDVFRNPTGSNITATVRIVGNLGSDAATTVFDTSDGDSEIETTDQWIGTDDADGTGSPAVIHYIHGSEGLQPVSVLRTGDNIEWTYDLTVPAGQTVRLATFTILAHDRAVAEAAAAVLVTPQGFGGQAAAFLTRQELGSLANFYYNLAPTGLAISNNSMPENLPAGALVGTLSADDANLGETFTYRLIDEAGYPDNASFSIVGDRLTTAAVFDHETKGSYLIRVRATDSGGLTYEMPLTITVTDANDAPTLADPLPGQTTPQGELFGFTFPADTFDDADGDPLSYAAALADGSPLPDWLAFDPATRTFSGTPGNQDVGTIAVRLTASDPTGASAADEFSLTVDNVNDPPIADPGGPYYVVTSQDLVLDGNGSYDPDAPWGDSIFSYRWDLDGHDTWAYRGAQVVVPWEDLVGYALGIPISVRLEVTDTFGMIATATTVQTIVSPVVLDPVDFVHLPSQDLTSGELWYQFPVSRDGWLTVEALRQDVELTLFDGPSFTPLTTSSPADGVQRLDEAVLAGEVFYLRLRGSGGTADLRLANLVHHEGAAVNVYGTAEDDSFTFEASAGHKITIRGVAYHFTPAQATSFSFNGLGGSDDVRFLGASTPDDATIYPTSGAFTGQGYSLAVANIESTDYDGGDGEDTLWIWGSKASNTYTARPGSAEMTGGGVSITAKAERIYGRGGGGTDTATIWDSPGNDVFDFFPIWARAVGDGYFHNLQGFTTMIAKAERDVNGTDEAIFRGSPQGDWLKSTTVTARMLTLGAWRHAEGFDTITAYSRGGKDKPDVLLLQDTPGADTFKLKPLETTLTTPDYKVAAYGFGSVEATRVNLNSADDKVTLEDSTGDDTFLGNPASIQISSPNPAYTNKAAGFPSVMAYSTGVGFDKAIFSDFADPADATLRDDTFTASSTVAELAGPGYRLWARFFDEVHAEAKLGRDIANLLGSLGIEELNGTATEVGLSGLNAKGTFANYAKHFDEIHASAGTGQDKAILTDASIEADYQPPDGVDLNTLSECLWLEGFEKVERRTTGGGTTEIDDIDRVFAYWQ